MRRRPPSPLRCSALAALVAIGASSPTTHARTWKDVTGAYSLDAELLAFDDERVILQRDSDRELGSVAVAKLSEADRAYLASKAAAEQMGRALDEPQVWKLKNGLQVPGVIVDYARRDVTVQLRRGKVYVNDRVFENLPAVYRAIVPAVIGAAAGNRVSDEATLRSWLVRQRGEAKSYTIDGVVIELEGGDEYGLPFSLLSDEAVRALRPGWEEWLAAADESASRRAETLELRSMAAAQDEQRSELRRIAELQLVLSAVEAGVTSLWEVTLYPGPGTAGPPIWMVTPGRDSLTATERALAANPGYAAGAVRRVSR